LKCHFLDIAKRLFFKLYFNHVLIYTIIRSKYQFIILKMSIPNKKLFLRVIPQTASQATASFIFLHGSGDTGNGLRDWVRFILGQDLTFPHIKIIYPTAPERPYTPHGGNISTVWFDRPAISFNAVEDTESTDSACLAIKDLISQEVACGIPINRIMIGGFSMGGCLAMHVAYRFQLRLAGCVCLSGFLNQESMVYDALTAHPPTEAYPPLLMCHGEPDPLVKYNWAKSTFASLQTHGILDSKFDTYQTIYHEINDRELQVVKQWITKRIPQI
uniref:palmitoyl-protein hydrolase n=1 Tax=Strigamia maritima TaxID=126957 RepID=T1JA26_STRMM